MNFVTRICLTPVLLVMFMTLFVIFFIACGIAVWQWGPQRLFKHWSTLLRSAVSR